MTHRHPLRAAASATAHGAWHLLPLLALAALLVALGLVGARQARDSEPRLVAALPASGAVPANAPVEFDAGP